MSFGSNTCLLLLPPNIGAATKFEIIPMVTFFETMTMMTYTGEETKSERTQVQPHDKGNVVHRSTQVKKPKKGSTGTDAKNVVPKSTKNVAIMTDKLYCEEGNKQKEHRKLDRRLSVVKDEIKFLESHLKRLRNLMKKVFCDTPSRLTEFAFKYTSHICETAKQTTLKDLAIVKAEDKYIVENKYAKTYLWQYTEERENDEDRPSMNQVTEKAEFKTIDDSMDRFKSTEQEIMKRKRNISLDSNDGITKNSTNLGAKQMEEDLFGVGSAGEYKKNESPISKRPKLHHKKSDSEVPNKNLLRSPNLRYRSNSRCDEPVARPVRRESRYSNPNHDIERYSNRDFTNERLEVPYKSDISPPRDPRIHSKYPQDGFNNRPKSPYSTDHKDLSTYNQTCHQKYMKDIPPLMHVRDASYRYLHSENIEPKMRHTHHYPLTGYGYGGAKPFGNCDNENANVKPEKRRSSEDARFPFSPPGIE